MKKNSIEDRENRENAVREFRVCLVSDIDKIECGYIEIVRLKDLEDKKYDAYIEGLHNNSRLKIYNIKPAGIIKKLVRGDYKLNNGLAVYVSPAESQRDKLKILEGLI